MCTADKGDVQVLCDTEWFGHMSAECAFSVHFMFNHVLHCSRVRCEGNMPSIFFLKQPDTTPDITPFPGSPKVTRQQRFACRKPRRRHATIRYADTYGTIL